MQTINIVTLGCSKNLVDSEKLMFKFQELGFKVLFDSNDTAAKIVIINTCGFIADAKEESLDTVLEFVQAKNNGLIHRLYVVGCLSERYREELIAEIPEVDGFFGVNDIAEVINLVSAQSKSFELGTDRLISTPNHYSYLKVSEGCNWRCSYCAIPLIRGKHRSASIESLVEEATKLAQKGVKELILIAQDLTYYGIDLYGKRALADLLRELVKIDGLEWIRLHYGYPAHFPIDVIELMATQPKICNYLDIPIQHISDDILGSMKRNIDKQKTIELIDTIRKIVPDIAIRTTLIVGYPNESEQQFEELKQFVAQAKFERLGVFAFCSEEDTAAGELEDNVPQEVKQNRVEQIMMLQNDIAHQINSQKIGSKLTTMIDRFENGKFIGRSQYDSPEVDGEIIIDTEYDLTIGEMYDVEITEVDGYDVFGKVN